MTGENAVSRAPVKPAEPTRKGRKIPRRITKTYLHNAGLHYLSRFAASTERFRGLLMNKVRRSCAHHTDQDAAECAALVEALVADFQRAGLLNDALYAESLVRSLRRQGRSARYIRAKSMEKGVSHEVANLLAGQDSEVELAAARHFAQKKKLGADPQKALAALARAGFSYDVAMKALNTA